MNVVTAFYVSLMYNLSLRLQITKLVRRRAPMALSGKLWTSFFVFWCRSLASTPSHDRCPSAGSV